MTARLVRTLCVARLFILIDSIRIQLEGQALESVIIYALNDRLI